MLEQEGEAISTAGIYYGTPNSGVISCVGTRPQSRGRGYARYVLYCCVQELLAKTRIPYLITQSDDLIPYYEAQGFELSGGRTVAHIR